MADQATEHISVAALPERCFSVAADLERYPEWANDVKDVEIKERDAEGRPQLVTFRAATFGRSTTYTLAYDYADAPHTLAWKLTQGDITTKLDGIYVFDPGEGNTTDVTYHLEAELRVPIPGFIKMRATSRIMATAMRELEGAGRVHVVSSGAPRHDGAGVTYGIDIGGTKVLGVALGPDNEVVSEARVPTPTGSREIVGSHVAEAVAEVTADLDNDLGPHADLAPIGVGAPGMVDRQGRLCFAPNLPQAHGVDWTALIGDRLPGRTIVIENDANLAVLAEHRLGAARGFHHVVMVTLGTGIGGGIVVNDRVQVGAAGFAGEIGHMVVDPNGPPCPCGRSGCWERFASGAGLGVRAREAALAGRLGEVVRVAGGDPESVRGEDVSAAAAAGDAAARLVIEQVGWWIGFGLANLTCVVDPESFVLGGGVVEAGSLLIDSARAAFEELVEGRDRRPLAVVVPAAFGERAGAIGAALAARQGGLW